MTERTMALLTVFLLLLAGCGAPDTARPEGSFAPAGTTPKPPTRIAPGYADGERGATPTPLPRPTGSCEGGCTDPARGCVVKGTIAVGGLKIYLLPGQPGYDAATISPERGERWFCTPNEALAAGWMPLKQKLPAGTNS